MALIFPPDPSSLWMPHGISNHDIIAKTFSIYTQRRRRRNESSITHNNTEEVMAVRYHVQCTTTLAAAKMKRIDLFLVLLLKTMSRKIDRESVIFFCMIKALSWIYFEDLQLVGRTATTASGVASLRLPQFLLAPIPAVVVVWKTPSVEYFYQGHVPQVAVI